MLAALRFDLQQQAFAQIARAHADGIELRTTPRASVIRRLRLLGRHRAIPTRKLVQQRAGQLLIAGRQVPILIQVADHQLRRHPQRLAQGQRAELPVQMVAQACSAWKESARTKACPALQSSIPCENPGSR